MLGRLQKVTTKALECVGIDQLLKDAAWCLADDPSYVKVGKQ
ncbi:hypothetical protein NBRC3188_1646 [Acetobacter pasteurianus NBRC 3188]|uniref:Uncharacterized protein n=1 Tax=Acetobacter pasteurianus NBRC 3188 TaxID=1226663 RepID=A0A401WUC0_ACEPA|nr:hypothetical protein NBRC3188_1646 [Acetobacter pasteurianus NBRC 3188]